MKFEWFVGGLWSWAIALFAFLLRNAGPAPGEGWPFRPPPVAQLQLARRLLAALMFVFGLVCFVLAFIL